MNHWPFILAAYGLTILGTAILVVQSWLAMRRAESAAQSVGRER